MKFTTEIYRDKTCFDEWNWKIKFVDNEDFEFIIQELPLYQMPYYILANGFIKGYGTTLGIAEADLDKSINIIKIIIIQHKKQKELEERIGQKLWEWDDDNNEFKCFKGSSKVCI